MAPKPINFLNTIIYKIQHIDNDELLYIGSTTDFIRRKCNHKSNCNNPNSKAYNVKLYTMIRCNGGWDNFKMIEVKKYPCNNSREAQAEEDKIMTEMKSIMNDRRSFRNGAQYYIDNHDKIRKNKREKIICDCGAVICRDQKARHKKSNKHKKIMENIE